MQGPRNPDDFKRSPLPEDVIVVQKHNEDEQPAFSEDRFAFAQQSFRPVKPKLLSRKSVKRTLQLILSFVGPGLVASIAYIDPGNWVASLSAGTLFGYAHLFVVLLAGLFAILLQTLACRLGIVTGQDLAQHIRAKLHDRPKNPRFWRWFGLYGLYVLFEIAVIATDLAEILGSAIAINLMCSRIPIWAGCLLTCADVFIVLLIFSNYPATTTTRSMRFFEFIVGLVVLVVLGCLGVLLHKLQPQWGQVFRSYLPTKGLFKPGAVYQSIAILGATVMPHALFLGSRIACASRITHKQYDVPPKESTALFPHAEDTEGISQLPQLPANAQDASVRNRNLLFIRNHIKRASIDIGLSLISVALVINSAILILAGAAFYDSNAGTAIDSGDLFSAHALIQERVGAGPAFLFALGLLCAGQAASVTVTLAGQVIAEGCLQWKARPWIRRIITRSIGLVPALVVSIAAGREAIDTLLVASQVILSIILPFVIFPLVWYTSDPKLMSVPREDYAVNSNHDTEEIKKGPLWLWRKLIGRPTLSNDHVSFANPRIVALAAWIIFLLICVCNVIGIVEVGLGQA